MTEVPSILKYDILDGKIKKYITLSYIKIIKDDAKKTKLLTEIQVLTKGFT